MGLVTYITNNYKVINYLQSKFLFQIMTQLADFPAEFPTMGHSLACTISRYFHFILLFMESKFSHLTHL